METEEFDRVENGLAPNYSGTDSSASPTEGNADTIGRDSSRETPVNQEARPKDWFAADYNPDEDTVEHTVGDKRSQLIPRTRFDEVLVDAKKAKKYADFIQKMEDAGGPEAYKRHLEAEEKAATQARITAEENRQKAIDTEAATRIKKLVDDGDISPDLADAMARDAADATRQRLAANEKARADFESVLATTVDHLKKPEYYPNLDERAVRWAAENNQDVVEAAKRSHDHITAIANQKAQALAEQRRSVDESPTPRGRLAGGPPAPPTTPKPGTPEYTAHHNKMKQEAENRRYGR